LVKKSWFNKRGEVEMTAESRGYWAFFCNPMRYNIEDRLLSEKVHETWQIKNWQRDLFRVGDKGIICVSVDKRPKPNKTLIPGIYAIVQVEGIPHLRKKDDGFWNEKPRDFYNQYVVDIFVTRNLLQNPVSSEILKKHPEFKADIVLRSGYGLYSSYPISEETYEIITSLIDW
jgi:hypothetical protein